MPNRDFWCQLVVLVIGLLAIWNYCSIAIKYDSTVMGLPSLAVILISMRTLARWTPTQPAKNGGR